MSDTPPHTDAEFDQFAEDYRAMLDRSVAASGESGEYFARFKARYARAILGNDFRGAILDYGCGVGLLTGFLLESFPRANVIGFDPSPSSVRLATAALAGRAHLTAIEAELPGAVDAVILANVMHHVPVPARQNLIAGLTARLSPRGRLMIFEHNPANPVTRAAVRDCPFDRDAVLLHPPEVFGYLQQAQHRIQRHDYIVFFPRPLRWLRPIERLLTWCPMGAQYAIVSTPHRS